MGIPYGSLTKTFPRPTIPAPAPRQRAWKLYKLYRNWFGRLYCQPSCRNGHREAFLRGMFELPKGAPGFYEARTGATWTGSAPRAGLWTR